MARYGFPGKVYPVNGKGGEVQGVPAYASILDLPGPVDLALVMVRAELVAGVLRDCAAAGVRILEELGVPWYTSAARAARGLTALVREA
jgi:acyl-CoA synthetase (NDP forming)